MPEITAKELESKRHEELTVLAELPKDKSSRSSELMDLGIKKLVELTKPRLKKRLLKKLQEKRSLQNTLPQK